MDEAEITRSLQDNLNFYRVKVQVKRRKEQLHILVTRDAANDIDYDVLLELTQGSLEQMSLPEEVNTFVLYGRVAGTKQPEWQKTSEISKEQIIDIGNLGEPLDELNELPEIISIHDTSDVTEAVVNDKAFVQEENLEVLEIPDYRDGPIMPPPLPPRPNEPAAGSMSWQSFAPIAVITVIVLVGGGWFVWDKSTQESKLAEAGAIKERVLDPAQLGKIQALEDNQNEIKKAVALLEEIPDRFGSPYEQAQAELAALRPKLEANTKKLTSEQSAATKLAAAKQLAKEASAMVQKPPHKLDVWQSAEAKWQEAVKNLEAIPAGTLAAPESKQLLNNYRRNSTAITAQVQKQRQLDYAASYWQSSISASTKNAMKQLKASGISKADFISRCALRIRPGLNPAQLQKMGFQVREFSISLCDRAWNSK